MLTLSEAARRVNRSPETIRRWIRSGRLPTHKVGRRHVIHEQDLLKVVTPRMLPLPQVWQTTVAGEIMPDVVAWIRRSRTGH